MSERVTLKTLTTTRDTPQTLQAINENFKRIADALDRTMTRTRDEPDFMEGPIDMNNNRIFNLPFPSTPTEPVRLKDLQEATGTSSTSAPPPTLIVNEFDIPRLLPKFWRIDGPRSMSFGISATDTGFETTVTARNKNDFAGILWYSKEKNPHRFLTYQTKTDYSGLTWQFRLELSGDVPFINDEQNGPTLTVIGRDKAGAPSTKYVRLANYAAVPASKDTTITLPFDSLKSGFFADEDVNINDIDVLMLGVTPIGYNNADSTRLATPQSITWKLSDFVVTGTNSTMSYQQVSVPAHTLRLCTSYDDQYDTSPKLIVENMIALGYRGGVNHYAGMSHYYNQIWDEGLGRYRVTNNTDVGLNRLNDASRKWHEDFYKLCWDHGITVITAVSYELFSEVAIVDWLQRDWDGVLGRTGYEPPSYLLSPCIDEGMEYLQEVFVEFASLYEAGIPIMLQIGEPWWWWNGNSRKPCVYDFPTKVKFNTATGLFAPDFGTIDSTATGTPYDEFKAFLQDQLGLSTRAIRTAVQAEYPDAKVSVLFFLPSILDPSVGIINQINYPKSHYRFPNFDFIQTEVYDWVVSGELNKSLSAFYIAVDELQYKPEDVHYLAGFAPDDFLGQFIPGYVPGSGSQSWRRIFGTMKLGSEYGGIKHYIWSYPQIIRDSITYLPQQFLNSFFIGTDLFTSQLAEGEAYNGPVGTFPVLYIKEYPDFLPV